MGSIAIVILVNSSNSEPMAKLSGEMRMGSTKYVFLHTQSLRDIRIH